MTKINIIAAIGKQNRVIGNSAGQIPWHISEDFKYFKKLTTGYPIVMGRKTFESFGGKILPDRHHVIITGQKNYPLPETLLDSPDISIASNLNNAIMIASQKASSQHRDKIFIIGGGEIYKQSIGIANRLYLTLVEKKDGTEIVGDVFFPEFKNLFTKSQLVRRSYNDEFNYDFVVLER